MIKMTFTFCLLLAIAMPAAASTRLKNICRVKGQEENVLRGMGLVVGLNGTGEANDGPTMRAIARAMEIMGNPLTMNGQQMNLRRAAPHEECRAGDGHRQRAGHGCTAR